MKTIMHKVGNNQMYLLHKGKGIHAKLRGWKPGHQDREPAFMWVFRKEVKPGMIVYDIGANVGYQTLIAAEILNGTGHVYALEPDPRNAKLLRMSVKKNGYKNVSVRECAISNEICELDFHLSDATNLSSVQKTKHSRDVVKVRAITLDSIVKENVGQPLDNLPKPQFIKMDVEGHEVEVLDGGMHLFNENFPCKILIEVHPIFYSDTHSLGLQFIRLFNLGFTTKYVISAAVARPDLMQRWEPIKIFKAGQYERGIYVDIPDADVLKLACHSHQQAVPNGEISNKIVRAIMLERGGD
jgi:FkbM family methyltransferase